METKTNPITVRIEVKVAPARAWELWTKADHVTKWNFASPDWHSPRGTSDLRPGGSFSFRMEAKDGSMGFDFGGRYDVVTANERIAYTMGDGRKVDVRFEKTDNGTRITETFDPETTNSIEMQQSGWQAILDNYKKYADSAR
jgi:uncharacterized protein YndB with AHSA1/START domain